MNRHPILPLLLLFSFVSNSQGVHLGVFAGVSSYNGDLADKIFHRQTRKAAFGITGTYEITDHISARASVTYTGLAGADRYSKDPELQARGEGKRIQRFPAPALSGSGSKGLSHPWATASQDPYVGR